MENHPYRKIDSRTSRVDCVFLSCFDCEIEFLASMLGRWGIRLHHACTVEMADFLLLATHGTVLVLDTTFLDGSWEDALAMAREAHPLVPTLICAEPADRAFVACAREHGAFAVLCRPIEYHRLRSSIGIAHEVTLERRLWAAERERERQSGPPAFPAHLGIGS